MAVVTSFSTPPQDAIYGIHNANIVRRLTTDNWRTRATVRLLGPASVYVWITKGTRDADEVYAVEVETDGSLSSDLGATFPTLCEALAYANGDAGGALGTTTPADRWPVEREATWVASSVARRR
jgi:hypothetical protein